MERVRVSWYGPFDMESGAVRSFISDEDFGIYMITRRWGSRFSNNILYIGLTYEQTFGKRRRQHARWLDPIIERVKVRIGYIRLGKSDVSPVRMIKDIENLLISTYEPQHNKIGWTSYRGRELKVVNKGRIGPLDEVVDSLDIK